MRNLLPILGLSLALGTGTVARAQDTLNSFSFAYRINGAPTVSPVFNGGSIVLPDTPVGSSSSATLFISSAQTVQAAYAVSGLAVTGTGFTAQASPSVPPGNSGTGTVAITFAPRAPGAVNGSIQLQLISPTNTTFTYTFFLFGNGLAAKIVTSYVQAGSGDQVPIGDGGTIAFPSTPVNGSATDTFVIANTGTGASSVDSVSLTGAGFAFTGLALVPATLPPGNEFRFGIGFSPIAAQSYTGTLQVSIGGQVSTYQLQGQGSSSSFAYRLLSSAGSPPVFPGGTIAFPDTPADGASQSTATLQITNTGNQDGVIGGAGITGADFQLANPPIFPLTLRANGGTALVSVVFQPKQPGVSTGRLQVGNDVFTLNGTGLGALLTLSADVGAGSVPVPNKGTLAIPNTAVGGTRAITVTVTNSGNQPAAVNSFSVSGAVFSTPDLPALPIALAPGQSQNFSVRFAPTALGSVSGSLSINDQTVTLTGAGNAPAALPTVSFTGVPVNISALQQLSAGLQLATVYSADIHGVLTLTFLSDSFVDDPSIRFATGNRTLNFTIPAGSTQAVFDQLGRGALFQTGTLSGAITLAATFIVGQVDITPSQAPALRSVIAPAAPQLRSVRIGSQTGNSVALLISGYSTSRAVNTLAFQLTGVSGSNFQTGSLSTDVSSAFAGWYTNPASNVFGSQFTITVTLNVAGDPAALQSVSVTAANSIGASQAQSVSFH